MNKKLLALSILALIAVPTTYSVQTYSTSYAANIRALNKSLKVPLREAPWSEYKANLDILDRLFVVDIRYYEWEEFNEFMKNKPLNYDLYYDRDARMIWIKESFQTSLIRVTVYQHNTVENFVAWLRYKIAPPKIAEPI